jgi:hypothetical protein
MDERIAPNMNQIRPKRSDASKEYTPTDRKTLFQKQHFHIQSGLKRVIPQKF